MTSPQHLHALANVWSLTAIWPALVHAAQNAAEAADPDRGTVQAWRPGSGVLSGRTGDVVLDAIVRGDVEQANPYADRLHNTRATLAWIAAQLGVACVVEADTLPALLAALPGLKPPAALNVALWVGAEDRHIRKLLHEPTDHAPLPGLRCPYCDTRMLAMRSSHPRLLERPIICTAGCTCDGDRCPCGMSATVEGLPHIWDQELLAAALDSKDVAA